jgi:2-polyprenyl-3-methyl-5-hydroxy-6-metoxy-1,4-benzoquinol methylase
MTRLNERLLRESRAEAEYFDREYAEDDVAQGKNNYSVPDTIIRQVLKPDSRPLIEKEYAYSCLGPLSGKRLLDYGAGDGWNSVCFAKANARVVAIDISQKGIALIRKKAKANNVAGNLSAEVQNCYQTSLESSSFDIVYGGGILHHLDVDEAGREIRRLLKADGVAVFFEPMRETRIMDVIKAFVLFVLRRKALGETEGESPMNEERIARLNKHFRSVQFRYFNVLTSASLIFKSESLKRFLCWADFFLINYLPGFKKLGRAVVIELREPLGKAEVGPFFAADPQG